MQRANATVNEGGVDRYQDFVLNINFGLANYGHLAYYNQMGRLL